MADGVVPERRQQEAVLLCDKAELPLKRLSIFELFFFSSFVLLMSGKTCLMETLWRHTLLKSNRDWS